MNFLTRTITVLVVISLIMGNFTQAQEAPDESRPSARGGTSVPATPQPVPPIAAPSESVPELEPAPTPMPAPPGMLTISGMTGIDGVMMQGLPGIVISDQSGMYSVSVPPGWSGIVKPMKEGFIFEPSEKRYNRITNDQTNQNYIATKMTFTISGRTGVSGVIMTGLPGNPVTDPKGYYTTKVPPGWSGTIRPKKDGFTFEPSELRYSRVMGDVTNQNYSPKTIGPMPMFARTGSREVLVIPDTDIKAETLMAITEDLQVMSRIFDERFKEPQEIQGVFFDFGDFFGRDSRSTEAIYMQGYGVLFLMEVNFAFTPEPKVQEKQVEETENADPIWQRTREKIFSPPGFGDDEFVPEQKYSADKIDQLKTELIRTLKHTANIRNIQPDEWVILTVIGKARQSGGMYQYRYLRSRPTRTRTSGERGRSSSSSRRGYSVGGGTYGGGMGMGGMYGGGGMGGMAGGSMGGGGFSGGMMMGGGMMGGMGMGAMYGEDYSEAGSTPATVLTIRAKKSDVDEFARKGDIFLGEFQEKVEIFIY